MGIFRIMKNKYLTIPEMILCAVLALAFSCSADYIQTGSFSPSVGYYLASAVLFAALTASAALLRYALSVGKPACASGSRFFAFFGRLMESRFHVIIIAALIFICWLPALWFLYPGTLINDTWGQLIQYIKFTSGEAALNDHHPVFDTLLMGTMIVPFAQKTGEWHYAIFFYVLLQSALTALAFSCTVRYVYKKLGLGAKAAALLTLVYCLLPIYPASTQTVSKDALYSWIFVFFSLLFMEIVRSEGEALRKGGFLAALTLAALFCCLTKKLGIYVLLGSLVILLLFLKRNRLFLLVPAVAAVLVMYVILPPLFSRLEVRPGGKQEKYSLPFQMTARYLKDHGDDVTEEEYEAIGKVLYVDQIAEAYDPTWADPVKLHKQKGADEDYLPYLKVWLQMGLRHPDSYIAAANSMLAGWFSWTEYAPLMDMEHRNQLDSRYIPKTVAIRYISEKSALSYRMMFDKLYENPFTRLFFTYGSYASLLPAFIVCTGFRKWKSGKRYWTAMVPMLLSLALGCWLAPASVHLEGKRYLYPITYTIPLLFMWCVYMYRENRED